MTNSDLVNLAQQAVFESDEREVELRQTIRSLTKALQSIVALDKEHIRMSVETYRECSDGIYRWSATDREWKVAMEVLQITQYIAGYTLEELLGGLS